PELPVGCPVGPPGTARIRVRAHVGAAVARRSFRGRGCAPLPRTRGPSHAGRLMADPSTYRPAPGTIPVEPGVYRFLDDGGRVLYVGKAKNLRARLSNYFQDVANLHPRTRQMVQSASKVIW